MTEPDNTPLQPLPLAEEPPVASMSGPPGLRARRWVPWTAGVGGALLGMGLGAVITLVASDPTSSDEYQELVGQMSAEQSRASSAQEATEADAESAIGSAEASASSAAASASQFVAGLEQREADVTAREQAVNALVQRIAATSIEQGTWTVGRDIEPGTYRTAQAVTGDCYWGIYRSGSNGDDIIENDIVNGGFPTVTLSVGQDFENNGCGTFIKE